MKPYALLTCLLSLLLLPLLSHTVNAHSGRTNAQGCHNDNVNGGYHCHNAPRASSPPPRRQSSPSVNEAAKPEQAACHPSYSGCLRADASDYDCAGGSGNGPYYTGRVRVIGPDVFGLDRDGNGWGCE